MEDLSKRTVSILLVVAVILTIVFTWLLLNSGQQVIIQQQQPQAQPSANGQVKLMISQEELGKIKQGGNLRLLIDTSKGG